MYLGDADGPDVLAVAGGSISGAHEAGQEAAQPLSPNAAANGVGWWWRRTCTALKSPPSTTVLIKDC
jgi:hypothetical protein